MGKKYRKVLLLSITAFLLTREVVSVISTVRLAGTNGSGRTPVQSIGGGYPHFLC
jgi:hypothetical protein